MQAVIDGADIINCSLAFTSFNKSVYWYMLSDALKDAYDQGSLVVCSAGNYINSSLQPAITLPSSSEYVLSVTGLNETLKPTYSTGTCVDISAPGINIPTAYKGSYKYLNGTSFSSPITASVYAEILTLNPSFTPEMLIDIIKETAVSYDETCALNGITDIYGTGYIDAIEATGIERVDKVIAGLNEGSYKCEITLSLATPEGADIYYSLNQSEFLLKVLIVDFTWRLLKILCKPPKWYRIKISFWRLRLCQSTKTARK